MRYTKRSTLYFILFACLLNALAFLVLNLRYITTDPQRTENNNPNS